MSLYSTKTVGPSPPAETTIALLAEALDGRRVTARHRVIATSDSHSPDEGLAVLQAYVAIGDATVRQGLLDLLIAIAGTNSYER